MLRLLSEPWPWYVAGPLIGLFVPALLLIGKKELGVSGSLRRCAQPSHQERSSSSSTIGKDAPRGTWHSGPTKH